MASTTPQAKHVLDEGGGPAGKDVPGPKTTSSHKSVAQKATEGTTTSSAGTPPAGEGDHIDNGAAKGDSNVPSTTSKKDVTNAKSCENSEEQKNLNQNHWP